MALPIAVFGVGGFIGGMLTETLEADARYEVLRFTSRDCDLADPVQVRGLASRIPEGAVWVLCAAVSPDRAGSPKAGMQTNIAMACNLADLAPDVRPAHIVFMSSIDVYGRAELELPLDESSRVRPTSYYGVSKWASEQILALECREMDIPLAILRLPGVYGPGDTHHGPVRNFIDAALRRKPITVFGDGNQRRDLLYVRDVPGVVSAICARQVTGVFNAVTGRTLSLNEMLDAIGALAGRTLDIRYEREASQIDLMFAPPALLRALPEVALTPLEKGIAETYAALRELPEYRDTQNV